MEDLFEVQPVRTGDTIFVPAGTPHSIGPNMVICEVQEYSDLTYRVYDFGRVDAHGKPRELHIDKALQVARAALPGRIARHAITEANAGWCPRRKGASTFCRNRLRL